MSVLKLYVITAIQAGKPEKVTEFFERLGPELHGQAEWKEWFGKYIFLNRYSTT